MPITPDQRLAALSLLQAGELSNEEIASAVGLTRGSVIAIKANIAMGRYNEDQSDNNFEDLIEQGEKLKFDLERNLQVALRANIKQLDSGFRIADDGKERITNAGNIDITARDDAGVTVVIELKAGIAQPQALTQLMAYMGAIGEEEGTPPRGILIAQAFHPKLLFAVKAISTVKLLRYRFVFSFEHA